MVQPYARDDFYKTDMETPVSGSVGLNDALDQIEDPIFSLTSQPVNGTLEFRPDGTFIYIPNKGFSGQEQFTYKVCSSTGLCSSAKAVITVVPFTIVNLTPGLSTVREGGNVFVTALLERPFPVDVIIQLRYKGKAIKGSDYDLSEQYQSIRIPKGQVTTSDRVQLFASVDNLEEEAEDVIIEIVSTSHADVRIGSGAIVLIHNGQSSLSEPRDTETPHIGKPEPQPLVSPNGDNNNDYFQIRNLDKFPNNEVVIFNRWGNEVFRIKGYNESNGRVFRGNANRGLTIGNEDLPDGVYYYLITPDTQKVQAAADLLKGYLILKRN
jgi:gliding motility-associated-like protein